MKSASLSEIKKEIQHLSAKDLTELCISLAKYKNDNKEYLTYLLFEAHDKEAYVKEVKLNLEEHFSEIKLQSNLYYVKKSLRKVLRSLNKYCKYLGDKALAAELHIYFCRQMKDSGISFRKSQLLVNLYEQELKKINTLVSALHEDLQGDYRNDIENLYL